MHFTIARFDTTNSFVLTNNTGSNVLLKIGLVGFKKKKKMYIYIYTYIYIYRVPSVQYIGRIVMVGASVRIQVYQI